MDTAKAVLITLFMFGMVMSGCAGKIIEQSVPEKHNVSETPPSQPTYTDNTTTDQSETTANGTQQETPDTSQPVPAQIEPQEQNVSAPTTPMDTLTDETIQRWGADCRNKATTLETADCILDWQERNIFWCYTHPEMDVSLYPAMFEQGYTDCVVDMQFNQMSPGSFPVSKVMDIKTRNGKMFGACYTYATTYCAVARWNGLTCRIMIAERTPTESIKDMGAEYCGLAPKAYVKKLGLICDEWKTKGWKMDALHYWAEININGEWKIMERPTWAYMHDTQRYIIDAGISYKQAGW